MERPEPRRELVRRAPQRRCVICRGSGAKKGLLRFVIQGNELVWDSDHTRSGRGAYVHPSPACWSRMVNAAQWEHALRLTRGSLLPDSLRKAAQAAKSSVPELRSSEPDEKTARRGNAAGKKVKLKLR